MQHALVVSKIAIQFEFNREIYAPERATMSVLNLRLSYFQADKICSVKGGYPGAKLPSASYRITTYKGPELGLMGEIPGVLYRMYELNCCQAANAEIHEHNSPSLLQKLKRRCMGH